MRASIGKFRPRASSNGHVFHSTASRIDFCWGIVLVLICCKLYVAFGASSAEAWVQRFTAVADSVDAAAKVVTDGNNNVFVAGRTDDLVHGDDWLIIKYAANGAVLWTNRLNGPRNWSDSVRGMAADLNGNLYVAGRSLRSSGNYELTTIAYSPAGVALWTNRYNAIASGTSHANALVCDSAGNVFVTGAATGVGTSYDFVTVAYSSAGIPLWTNRYGTSGDYADEASDICLDVNGNILVVGYSSGGVYQGATIKYSSGGTPQWTNIFPSGTLFSCYVAADAVGNVFVTGNTDSELAGLCVTLAYSTSGTKLWTNRFVGAPSGLKAGSAGEVYVVATSPRNNSSADIWTVKYAPGGTPAWTNRYNGPLNSYDFAGQIVQHPAGHVVVAGTSSGNSGGYDFATIVYSTNGAALWTNRYDGAAHGADWASSVTADGVGNIVVTGYSTGKNNDYDFATIKYSGMGVALWTNRHNGSASTYNQASALAVDSSGNVFVSGSSYRVSTSNDYATVAYSRSGVPLWTNYYDGGAFKGDDRAQAIAVDQSGNVFVTGYSAGLAYDYATIAYASNGLALWTNRYAGPSDLYHNDQAYALAAHSNGRIAVSGYASSVSSGNDYATIVYASSGSPLWTNLYNGTGNADDTAWAVAFGPDGSVFVTGQSFGNSNYYDYATIKYSDGGLPQWTNRYDGPWHSYDIATALAVDTNGDVIVTGYSAAGYNNYDYATIRYGSDGTPLWTNRYAGPGGTHDYATSIALDAQGNAFVAGNSAGANGSSYGYATIAYSRAGLPLWTNSYRSGFGNDFGQAVAVSQNGDVYVAGNSTTGFESVSRTLFDIVVVAYSGSGLPLWTNRYNGPAKRNDVLASGHAIATGLDGSLYVVGNSDANYGSTTNADYVVIKYVPQPRIVDLEHWDVGVHSNALRCEGYPNAPYILQYASDLDAGGWLNLSTNYAGDDGIWTTIDTTAAATRRFYRIRVP